MLQTTTDAIWQGAKAQPNQKRQVWAYINILRFHSLGFNKVRILDLDHSLSTLFLLHETQKHYSNGTSELTRTDHFSQY